VELELYDPGDAVYYVNNERGIVNSSALNNSFGNLTLRYSGQRASEWFEVTGLIPHATVMIMRTQSLKFVQPKHVTVVMNYSYGPFSPCPAVPIGCTEYNLTEAQREVDMWSNFARSNYSSNATQAWEAMAEPIAIGGTVAWNRFGALWKMWPSSSGRRSTDSWKYAFALMDSNKDLEITRGEFSSAFFFEEASLLQSIKSPASFDVGVGGMVFLVGACCFASVVAAVVLRLDCCCGSCRGKDKKTYRSLPAADGSDAEEAAIFLPETWHDEE
ncbi:unnamed protein product, partial [Polarella glacialis]